MDTHRPPRQRPRPARASGEGTGQVRGRREPPPRRGARRSRAPLVLGADVPPPPGPVGIAVGSREREDVGEAGSVRPACSGPEGSPSATCPSGPAALLAPGCPGSQLRRPARRSTPGLWEVRPSPPPRACALGRLLPRRGDGVWARPEARCSQDRDLGQRLGK